MHQVTCAVMSISEFHFSIESFIASLISFPMAMVVNLTFYQMYFATACAQLCYYFVPLWLIASLALTL